MTTPEMQQLNRVEDVLDLDDPFFLLVAWAEGTELHVRFRGDESYEVLLYDVQEAWHKHVGGRIVNPQRVVEEVENVGEATDGSTN